MLLYINGNNIYVTMFGTLNVFQKSISRLQQQRTNCALYKALYIFNGAYDMRYKYAQPREYRDKVEQSCAN